MDDARLKKTRKILDIEKIDALLVHRPIDLYYLLGLDLSAGRLLIEADAITLFVDGRYFEICREHLPFPVILSKNFEKESDFGKWPNLQSLMIGFDADALSFSEYQQLNSLGPKWVPLNSPIKKIREIKDEKEIALLRKAASLGSKGYDHLLKSLREGMTEKEAAKELELFWIRSGADGLAFAPHIAFGEGAAYPHYHPTSRSLKQGDAILMDIGVILDHYHSDMTRVNFYGEPPQKIQEIYQITYEAYMRAVECCKPNVLIGDVDRAARKVIEEAGYGDYFTHGLGHGVGLEIHEFPAIRSQGADASRPLQAGMVITIEPGIYLPTIGGVRLEDTLLITPTGSENLTQRPLDKLKVELTGD